ncbi:MAG: hypothetical protein WC719_00055 [Patescibacteria group bacterium]|jgi:hypothetical protein
MILTLVINATIAFFRPIQIPYLPATQALDLDMAFKIPLEEQLSAIAAVII